MTTKRKYSTMHQWYVEWANSLDSAGQDSSLVRARLTHDIIQEVDMLLYDFISVAKRADELKKHLYYGKEMPNRHPAQFINALGDTTSSSKRLNDHEITRFLHAVLGLIDETGELAQILHGYVYYGAVINWTNVKEEVGDAMWYMALLAKYCNVWTFSYFQMANYHKLSARYPEGSWTQERALTRDLEAETKALEKNNDDNITDEPQDQTTDIPSESV